jgi:hypothetical protein
MATSAEYHGRFLDGMSGRFRDARNVGLRSFIATCVARKGRGPFHIADLGGNFPYWRRVGIDFLDRHDIVVTCFNNRTSELKAGEAHPRLRAEVGDACHMAGVGDNAFDFVHSNSVVEHVGRFHDMMRFAREVRRLAPAYYVQTPYVLFPIDPHFPRLPFYHWLPQFVQLAVLRRVRIGARGPFPDVAHAMGHVDGTQMLDRRRFRALFPEARHRVERWALLTKSLIAEHS